MRPAKKPNPRGETVASLLRSRQRYIVDNGFGTKGKGPRVKHRGLGITRKPSSKRLPKPELIKRMRGLS